MKSKSTNSNTHKKAMIEALKKTLGVVTNACKKVGIDRKTHYDWLKKDEDYRNEVLDIEDMAIDFAESKLHASINNGSDTATIFFLKTKGKKRGYVERTETQIEGNLETTIFYLPQNGREPQPEE